MADRKVINRYYPPDFDPAKLLPVKAFRPQAAAPAGPKAMAIRMMLPFTMRCAHCNEYLYIATKFNSKCVKAGTSPLGLNSYRFFGNCKHCKGEFVFRTDPEQSDYILESGGVRTYDAMKDADLAEQEAKRARAEAEQTSESVALENKIYDTAEEMRRIEELGELRAVNKREARNRNVVIDAAIQRITQDIEGGNVQATSLEDEIEFRELKRLKHGGHINGEKKTEGVGVQPAVSKTTFSTLGIRVKPKANS